MSRPPDSGRLDLGELFHRAQQEMLAQLAMGGLIEHGPTAGAATERHWIALFERYLPKRYRASSAFVIDSRGNRSRQIDIAIYDHFYSPLLFPQESAVHIPAESVYAVFEVKPSMSRPLVRDAAAKVASVRALHRTSATVISAGKRCSAVRPNPILGGLLAASSVWSEATFAANITPAVTENKKHGQLDLGCCLEHGAFEYGRSVRVSLPEESLIFFILRLLERLRAMGTAPAVDWTQYGRSLRSFRKHQCR
ncbi:MAG: hypothetical protein JWO19_106 [Bryobacterales bacterium]|jgi:hypothetical protein|nr:hypothetical protein [Bryobacterales bacterium]